MPINHLDADVELLPAALVFESVARCGSFRGAAAELSLSPSTVSARVAALEDALGLRLLHRTTRSVTLTPAGTTLREELRPILPQWRIAEERVRAHAAEPQGVVTVTAPDIFMSMLVVPVAAAFQARYPKTRIVFRTTLTTLSLIDERVDVAVRGGPLPPSEHGARLLWQGDHIAVASPDWVAAHDVQSPAQLAEVPTLALAGRRALSEWRNTAGESASHRARVTMEADTVQVYLALIEAGAGLGVLPELIALPGLSSGRLLRVLPTWVSDAVSFHVVTPSSRSHGAAVRCFVSELVEQFDGLHA